jgi:hypothetical protein
VNRQNALALTVARVQAAELRLTQATTIIEANALKTFMVEEAIVGAKSNLAFLKGYFGAELEKEV